MNIFKKGKRKIKDPCPGCGLNRKLCLCSAIPRLDFKTRVTLILHAKEIQKATNTGRLAHQALVNSQILVRGERGGALDLGPHLNPEYETVVLFPAADAKPLTPVWVQQQTKQIHLLVPDGNWRQAQKVLLRQPELAPVPKIFIATPNLGVEHLRKESSVFGRSTLEAIAEALKWIEGEERTLPLFELYQLKLQNTLRGRRGEV